MKKILLLVAALAMTGCTNPVEEWKLTMHQDLDTIKGLEDCTYSQLFTGSTMLHIVRCPNSVVSTRHGQANRSGSTTVTSSK